MEAKFIVLANLVVTAFLTGLIWFVQIVHYPSFAKVPPQGYDSFHQFHVAATGAIVALPMLAELFLAFALLLFVPEVEVWQRVLFMVTVAGLWALTFFLFVPLHGALSAGFDATVIKQLVRWNWLRTMLWTARLVGLIWCMARL